jgi:hypothetical protein
MQEQVLECLPRLFRRSDLFLEWVHDMTLAVVTNIAGPDPLRYGARDRPAFQVRKRGEKKKREMHGN